MVQQRKVKRQLASGRQGAIHSYQTRNKLMMPQWARQFVVERMGWMVIILTLLLTPVAILGLVLGVNSLSVLGRPANETGLGLSVVVLLAQFVLMVASIRPLFDRKRQGWNYITIALLVHFVYDILQQVAVRGVVVTAIGLYVLLQIRNYYTTDRSGQ